MGKLNVYSLNVYNSIPALVDELYNILVGGDAVLGSLTLTNTTPSTNSGVIGAVLSAGGISISNTTDAVSVSNGGSITTAGGAAIAKKLYVGGEIFASSGDNATSSTDGGALTVTGGLAVSQDVHIGNDLYVHGTLKGITFVPLASTSSLTNISSISVTNKSSVRTDNVINFACICIVTPTSITPQDTSFRLTIDSSSYPPNIFVQAYDLSPVVTGWANSPSAPVNIENCLCLGVTGTQSFFIKFTSYDNNPHYVTVKIAYAYA